MLAESDMELNMMLDSCHVHHFFLGHRLEFAGGGRLQY